MTDPARIVDEAVAVAARVLDRFEDRGATLAVAESCTGGLVASCLTDVPGASRVLRGAVVAYTPGAKVDLLGVDRDTIDGAGAVSDPVAAAMATGIRERLDATWGLAATGVAGPTGGTDDTPVGSLVVGLAGPDGTVDTTRHRLDGDRRTVKARMARQALSDLDRRDADERP